MFLKKKSYVLTLVLLLAVSTVLFTSVGVKAANEKPEILVTPKGLSQSYWLTVKAGAEEAAEEFGAEIFWKGPTGETGVTKQVNVIRDYIRQDVDAIVAAATDATALVPPLKDAHEKGIPVITIDSGIDADFVTSHIATNNVEAAKTAGNMLAEQINKEGKVASIPFVAGAATSQAREKGFEEAIKEYDNISIVATQYSKSDYATAMKVTNNILTANPDLDGIFAANEAGLVGAARALKSRGKVGEVKLIGFDGADTEIEQLKAGVAQGLVVQRPFQMGYLGVKHAIQKLEGKDVPKKVDTGVVEATKENMDQEKIHEVLYPLESRGIEE
mgnify:CR=1 FL=1